jgi:hypothetical protein
MRIYYCGHLEPDAIKRLADVGAGKKSYRCGATAYHRCDCGEAHPDVRKAVFDQKVADHPKFLCSEHIDLYA